MRRGNTAASTSARRRGRQCARRRQAGCRSPEAFPARARRSRSRRPTATRSRCCISGRSASGAVPPWRRAIRSGRSVLAGRLSCQTRTCTSGFEPRATSRATSTRWGSCPHLRLQARSIQAQAPGTPSLQSQIRCRLHHRRPRRLRSLLPSPPRQRSPRSTVVHCFPSRIRIRRAAPPREHRCRCRLRSGR